MTSALAGYLAIGVTFLGCSSDNSDAGVDSCGKVAPCGGDIVGTWRIIGSCGPGSPLGLKSVCPNQAVETATVSIIGTATFNWDMTYMVFLTQSASGTLVLPMSCLESHGITVTCDEVAAALGGPSEGDAATTTNMGTCTADASTCDCSFAMSGPGIHEMGTYSVSGHTLSTTSSGSPNRADYCVQGNSLRVISPTGMGTATLISTAGLVATKE